MSQRHQMYQCWNWCKLFKSVICIHLIRLHIYLLYIIYFYCHYSGSSLKGHSREDTYTPHERTQFLARSTMNPCDAPSQPWTPLIGTELLGRKGCPLILEGYYCIFFACSTTWCSVSSNRLCGSYENLAGGLASEALTDFTGGVAERFNFREELPDNTFQMMLKAQQRGSLMGCSIDVRKTNLLSLYTLLNCKSSAPIVSKFYFPNLDIFEAWKMKWKALYLALAQFKVLSF